MTFDILCIYSGITYCKRGYLRCMPHICRHRNHTTMNINHPETKKFVELPNRKYKIIRKR